MQAQCLVESVLVEIVPDFASSCDYDFFPPVISNRKSVLFHILHPSEHRSECVCAYIHLLVRIINKSYRNNSTILNF